MIEKGPMCGNLLSQQNFLTSNTLRGIGGEVIVEKIPFNILDLARSEQIPPNVF